MNDHGRAHSLTLTLSTTSNDAPRLPSRTHRNIPQKRESESTCHAQSEGSRGIGRKRRSQNFKHRSQRSTVVQLTFTDVRSRKSTDAQLHQQFAQRCVAETRTKEHDTRAKEKDDQCSSRKKHMDYVRKSPGPTEQQRAYEDVATTSNTVLA